MSVRIKFNDDGFRELLTSPGAKALLHEHADPMLERANAVPSTTEPPNVGPYYKIEDRSDTERARLNLRPTSARAAKHEHKTHALQRALGE